MNWSNCVRKDTFFLFCWICTDFRNTAIGTPRGYCFWRLATPLHFHPSLTSYYFAWAFPEHVRSITAPFSVYFLVDLVLNAVPGGTYISVSMTGSFLKNVFNFICVNYFFRLGNNCEVVSWIHGKFQSHLLLTDDWQSKCWSIFLPQIRDTISFEVRCVLKYWQWFLDRKPRFYTHSSFA